MPEPARPNVRLLALLVLGVTLALYLRTGSFGFVEYDDPGYVRDNPHLTAGLTGESVRWAFTSLDYQYNWHPLTWLSHALDVSLFGLDAGPHHLLNALLHAATAALLLLALHALTGNAWTSALAACLFALHPLRVEAVAWISERKELLAGFFCALTLLLYARHARAPSRARMTLTALALTAGLLSKPTLVTLPFALLLLDFWPLGRLRKDGGGSGLSLLALVREKAALFALSLGACITTLLSQSAGGAIQAAPLGERLLHAPVAVSTYLAQYFAPRGLAVFYPHPLLVEPERSRLLPSMLALALLVVLSAGAWRARRTLPWLAVGWCWFLGLLVPMIGLVQVGTLAHADRYVYLAGIGLDVALAWSVLALVRARPAWRNATLGAALACLGCLAALSWRQSTHWRDSRSLFEHARAVTEHNYVAHNTLGLLAQREGEAEEALEHFEAATAAWPGFFEGWLNVGLARYQRGEFAAARPALTNALQLDPGSREGRLCLVATLLRMDERGEARRLLDDGLRHDPGLGDDPRARELGRRLGEDG